MELGLQKSFFFFKKEPVLQNELQVHELWVNLSLYTKYKTKA